MLVPVKLSLFVKVSFAPRNTVCIDDPNLEEVIREITDNQGGEETLKFDDEKGFFRVYWNEELGVPCVQLLLPVASYLPEIVEKCKKRKE